MANMNQENTQNHSVVETTTFFNVLVSMCLCKVIWCHIENQATNQKDKQTEDIREIKKILNEFCDVHLKEEDVAKVICMEKFTESKKRLVIMTIKTEEKKKEIFKNLQKLRRSDENITITHDLTQK